MRKSSFLQNSKDMLHRSFKPDKCKTSLRLVVSRLKLMKNKKEVQVKVYRREVAQLLESGQDPSARIKVEHVVREEKMMAAYELISLYSEIVMTRMPIIESQKNCPIDLKEAITSLIFASPRCSDIPELADVQKHFTAKYGKDFVFAAIELRPDCGVSRLLVEKLSAKAPDGQTKLKILTAIAEEHKIEWEPKSFGEKESTASTDLLKGPASFQAAAEHIKSPPHQPPQTPQTFQAAAMHAQSPRYEPSQVLQERIHYQPSKVAQNDRFSQGSENVNSMYSGGRQTSTYSQHEDTHSGVATARPETQRDTQSFSDDRNTFSSHGQNRNMDFKDAASAAQAAAESAEQASMAARAATELASREGMRRPYYTESHPSGPHLRRDSSEFAGEQLQTHSSNSYDFDRNRRLVSDHLQGLKFKNPGGNQGGYGPHFKRDSSEPAGNQLQKHSSDSYDSDRHRRLDSDHLQGVKSKNPGSNTERYNQPGYGPHISGEQLRKHSSNSHDSDRHRRSDSDHPQGVKFKNPGGNAERSNQGGYEPHLKRDSSEFAGEQLQTHSSNRYDSDRHRRSESNHLQGVKFKNSGGTPERSHQGDLQINDHVVDGSYGHSSFDAGKSSRKSMYKEETTKPNSIAKSQYKESEYRSDDHGSLNSEDFHHIQAVNSRKSKYKEGATKPDEFSKPQFKSHAVDDSHFRVEKGQIHTDTSRTGSGSSVFAVFDEEGSDNEDISFSTGPKYDDQDSDSDSMPSGKAAPSPHNFGFSGSKLPEKSIFDQSSSPEKNSSHGFPVISETSVEEFKFDDELPFDDSDGPSSEGEDSMHESLHTSKNYLETIPGSKGQIIPSPRLSYKKQGKKGVKKPHLKSTLDESADEVPTQSSSELSNKVKYGKLTGGLRHKSTQVDDASSTLENPVEERSGFVATHSRVSSEVKQNANSRKALSLSHDDLDMDSSEDERSAQGSGFGREPYTQTNSNSKISVSYFESDSDDDPPRPIQTSAGRKHMSIGLSRRTKVTPTGPSTTPKVQLKPGDAKSSNFSSGRESAFSSYDSRRKKDATTPGTPKLQKEREDPDDSDFSSDGSGSNDKRTNDLDFHSGRRTTFGSYGSHFSEETESLRRRSGQSRNSEQASSTRESSEHILEPLKPTPGREDLQQPPSGKSVPPPPPPPVAPHPPPPPPPPPILVKTNAPPAPPPPGKSAPPPPPPPVKTKAPPPPPPPGKSAPPPPPPPGKSAPPPPPPPGKSAPPLPPPRASPAGKGPSTEEDGADSHKTKLKPFFWDKVTADPDGSMVWHQLNSGSFRFNEEKIESLFGSASAEKNQNEIKKHSPNQNRANEFIQIIGQKKAHNFAILLKGLRVTAEEVYDALQEGNELPAELIETVLKMAPTAEEELKLRQYSGEISRLGIAERFLKVLVDIPFAFKRLESLLFIYTFQEDQLMVKESFATLEAACTELRNNRLFLKLLEAVLKTGNRMNDGTFRGRAQAFKLDTLLKLSDVKGADGKTTLLHFVVQEIIQSEGIRALRASKKGGSFSSIKSEDLVEDSVDDSEESYRDVGLQVVSTLGNDLQNVKKAAILNAESLTGTVVKLGHRFKKARNFLNLEMKNVDEENGFNQALMLFVQDAGPDIMWLLQEEKRIMALVKKTGDYFHGNTGKDEGLRIFIVVRDFLLILDKVCREVKNAPKKSFASPKGKDLTEKPLQPPPDPRQRLIAAIKDRKMENSSSEDEF